MLQNREEYKRQKQYRSLLNQEEEKEPLKKELKVEEVKNYDIKDLAEVYVIGNPKELQNIIICD